MAKVVDIRVPYVDYPVEGIVFKDPTLAKQEFASDCDFNVVMGRFQKTGVVENINSTAPQYVDVSDLVDYQAALGIVAEARDSFSALPSSVRERFGNNPAALIEFLNDASNRDEALSLGLLKVGGAESPPKGSVAPPAEPPQEASK